ncbi:MAG: alpha/beta family hydrolase [Myxococcota bacterium]
MSAVSDDWLIDNPHGAPTLILAHGAGAPFDTPFMNTIAQGVAAAGIRVVRFEFPYMRRRRTEGVKAGPNGAKILIACWHEIIDAVGPADKLFIGGKSMGGRIASMIADELGVKGVVCLGYPFHPAGKPDKLRTEHLNRMKAPTLIVQGTRDPMGRPDEVDEYNLSEAVTVQWIEDGDHSLKPRRRSGRTLEQNLAAAVAATVTFLRD